MEILSSFLKTHEISPILWYEYFIIVMISQCFLSLGNINQINSSAGGRNTTEQGYHVTRYIIHSALLCNGYLLVGSGGFIEYQNMFIIITEGKGREKCAEIFNKMKSKLYWLKTTFFILVMARSDYENGPAVVRDIWLLVVCFRGTDWTGLDWSEMTIMSLYGGQQLWDDVSHSQPLNTICQSLLGHHKWHGHTDTPNWGDTTGITPHQYPVSHLLQGSAPPSQLDILYQTTLLTMEKLPLKWNKAEVTLNCLTSNSFLISPN